MIPKIAIGLTTYLDISSPEFGTKLYDAYHEASPKIAPNKIYVWGHKYDVAAASDFSAQWCTEAEPRLIEDRGKGRLMEKRDFLIGCEWKHIGQPAGGGRVDFRPSDNPSRSNTILIDHNFVSQVEWSSLFQRLVAIFKPSYGMMHLFTDDESAASGEQNERIHNFDRAFGGEEHFVSWKTSSGDWRKPDKRQLDERRQYRFFPELSWANFLGKEFIGQYDEKFLIDHAANAHISEYGLYFEVTSSVSDIANHRRAFLQSRRLIKSAFKPGFFRRQDSAN